MNISEDEERELIRWGVKFFQMGFNAAFDVISKQKEIALDLKTKAVEEYIASIHLPFDKNNP